MERAAPSVSKGSRVLRSEHQGCFRRGRDAQWRGSHLLPPFGTCPGGGGASQVVLVVKSPPANAGDIRDMGSIPGLGRYPGGGHGSLLQYSCLENPMDRGAWRATIHAVRKSRTRLKRLRMQACWSGAASRAKRSAWPAGTGAISRGQYWATHPDLCLGARVPDTKGGSCSRNLDISVLRGRYRGES